MKPVEAIPGIDCHENPYKKQRMEEVKNFWESGAKYAEMTVFNPNTRTQTEVKHYERAARCVRLGLFDIEFHQRKGKVYAQRLREGTE